MSFVRGRQKFESSEIKLTRQMFPLNTSFALIITALNKQINSKTIWLILLDSTALTVSSYHMEMIPYVLVEVL